MSSYPETGELILNRYRVGHLLGEGGMGAVVGAVDTQLEREVAIKILSPQAARDSEATARFLQEARSAVRLHSEHVVRVYDVGTLDDGRPLMVMEMLRGADLEVLLANEGPLSLDDAVTYILEAADAVAEAHALGIIHRDIKPANLFLSRQADGRVRIKVLDFGISKRTSSKSAPPMSLTQPALLLGSPMYMSPEQLRSAADVDGRADVWALGVVLYELLTGDPPFVADNIPELSGIILFEEPQPVSSRCRRKLPAGIDGVLAKALAKDREQRYANVAEFSLALKPYAPKRCQPLLESILRVQHHAGLAPQELTLSIFPTRPPPSNPRNDVVATLAGAETIPAPTPRFRWLPWALPALLLVTALSTYLALRAARPEPAQPTASPAPATTSAVAVATATAPSPETSLAVVSTTGTETLTDVATATNARVPKPAASAAQVRPASTATKRPTSPGDPQSLLGKFGGRK